MDDGPPPSAYPLNEDGLGWWANSYDGSGLAQIRNADNNVLIKSFNIDFGTGISYQFRVGNPDNAAISESFLKIYPNPAEHDFLIDLGHDSEGVLKIELFTPTGQKVLDETRTGTLEALQYVHIEHYTHGLHYARIQFGDKILTQAIYLN
jgi:hypothetical protein